MTSAEGAETGANARRTRALAELRETPEVPILIIGGGIIGLGLLRELALNGVAAVLVDRKDFCCGASAAPSRMIHGGLRYLEYGDFELVRESVTERNRLLVTAPHYVTPLPTTVPIRSRFEGLGHILGKCVGLKIARPNRRGSIPVRIALTIYDWLSRPTRVMPKHSFSSRAQAVRKHPGLTPDARCTATYYDAQISYPERLGLELVLDSEAACPETRALNYVAAVSAAGDTVTLRDELTGETLDVRPTIVVNAAGPWIDFANAALGLKTTFVGGTKGGHLVLENPELAEALGDEMVLYETPEGRVCIAFVWQGKPVIGSTDLRIENPDDARCDDDEIDYMIRAIGTPFPNVRVDRSQILSTFSGVRPLAASTAADTRQVSRSHRCTVVEPGETTRFPVYAMIGGKWTPFRVFAEHVADMILPKIGRTRRADSTWVPIGGGRDYPAGEDAKRHRAERLAAEYDIEEDDARRLLARYGTRDEEVAAFCDAGRDRPLTHAPTYTRREIEFLVTRERVCRLDDIVLRRTCIALLGELTPELLDEIAGIAAEFLGWGPERVAEEIDRTLEILRRAHGLDLGSPARRNP